jgi:hypothetical protein
VLIPEPILRRLTDARILVILGIGAAVTLLGLLALLIDARAHQPYTVDFVLFYASGLHYFEGRDVYTIVPMDVLGPIPESIRASGSAMRANLNPPATVLLLAPLSKLPYAYAFWSWSLVSLACAVTAAWLLAGGYVTGARRFQWSLGLLVLLLAYSPTWIVFYIGQMTFPVLLLLAAGWRAARATDERAAGIILGLALAIKPFVGLLLILFLAYRRWRLLFWYACSFAAANLVALTFMGPDAFVSYLNTLKSVNWHAVDMNASIFGLLTRLSGSSGGQPLADGYQWLHVLGYAVSALLAGSLVLLVRRLPAWPSRQGVDIAFAYSLVLMLLISPLGWIYYFPILLICILVIFGESRTLAGGRLFRLAAGATWLVSAILHFLFVGKLLPEAPDAPFRLPDAYLTVLVSIAAILLILGRGVREPEMKTTNANIRTGPS